MKASKLISLVALPCLSCFIALSSSRAAEKAPQDRELQDRTVDQAALASKLKAVEQLQKVIQQRRGRPEEPSLLASLIELERKRADFEFRLAHGDSVRLKKPVDLKRYQAALSDVVKLSDQFIARFPRHAKIARVYYLRGKSNLELERKSDAENDFKRIVEHYRSSSDFKFASLALIDLLMERKDYPNALAYIDVMHATPADKEFYPMSLDRSARAYYYLGDIPRGLRFLEAELRSSKPGGVDRNRVFDSVVLFYSTAIDRKLPGYSVANSLAYFHSIANAEGFASMATQLGYVLRTKDANDDLELLKKSSLTSGLSESAQLEMILITFENQANRGRYVQMKDSLKELETWFSRHKGPIDRQDHVQQTLEAAAETLQSAFTDKNLTQPSPALGLELASVYELLLIVPAPPGVDTATLQARATKFHFNLAEVHFALRDYENALAQYRWVIDHGTSLSPSDRGLLSEAELRAISAKYELLDSKGVFPKNIEPKPINTAERTLPADVKIWLSWVDQFEAAPANSELKNGEIFFLEADRLLYSFGAVSEACARMTKEISHYNDEKYAMIAASLVLDTYVTSEGWEQAFQIANQLASARSWNPEFQRKIATIRNDSYFKTIEAQYKNGNYAAALERSDKFLTQYPGDRNRQNCIMLAANSALMLKDKERSLRYFAQLGKASPYALSQVELIKASVAEESYDFSSAARHLIAYLDYLRQRGARKDETAAGIEASRKKSIFYAFLASDSEQVSGRTDLSHLCSGEGAGELEAYCKHFDALAELNSPTILDKKQRAAASAMALSGKEDTAVWSMIALRNPEGLSLKQRQRLFNSLSKGWASEESIGKFLLIPHLADTVLENIEATRREIASSARIKRVEKRGIERRVRLLNEMEKMAEGPLRMPSLAVEAGTLSELAKVYSDLSTEIKKIPPPKGLSTSEKNDYTQTINQICDAFDKKAQSYQQQKASIEAANPSELEHDAIPTLVSRLERAERSPLIHFWAQSLRDQHWSQVAFFMTQLKGTGAVSPANYELAEGISIYAAGARAEGFAEIMGTRRKPAADLTKAAKAEVAGEHR